MNGRSAKAFALLAALTTVPLLAQDGQWLTYSGSYNSHRYSPLNQISTSNVARLRPAWVYQPPGTGSVESTPLVANGIMYVTSGPTMVAADCARRAEPRLSARQPRRRDSRQHGVRRHPRRLPRRARCARRHRTMVG